MIRYDERASGPTSGPLGRYACRGDVRRNGTPRAADPGETGTLGREPGDIRVTRHLAEDATRRGGRYRETQAVPAPARTVDTSSRAEESPPFRAGRIVNVTEEPGGCIVPTPVPGYPKVKHRTVDAASCHYQVLVQEAPRGPWRVLGRVQRFGSLPSMRGWQAKRDADGAKWTRKRLTRGDATADMVDAWWKERQSCSR